MTVSIQPIGRQRTRELILSAKGGILTDIESKTLDACLGFATHLWIGEINDKIACAWGLVPPSLLSDEAYLWLFSTSAVDEHKFIFVRYSQRLIEEMLRIYPTIVGVTDAKAVDSIRWLKWLGAKFGPPQGKYLPFTIIARIHG